MALEIQARVADNVVVVAREGDLETLAVLTEFQRSVLPLRTVLTQRPGVVSALNAGLALIDTDIVAITDDDAVPSADWLVGLLRHFEADCEIGGVGGKDRMFVHGKMIDERKRIVGSVPVVGRHIGNHHVGYGPPREVDVLKGVNCAYRIAPLKEIGFDSRMRGNGAQVNWEMSLGLALKRRGWKLLYDPAITVDHFPSVRFDEDQRYTFNATATENAAYNEMIARFDGMSLLVAATLLGWAVLIGTRDTPGLLQWFRFLPSQRSLATMMFGAAAGGRFKAWRDLRRSAGAKAPVQYRMIDMIGVRKRIPRSETGRS